MSEKVYSAMVFQYWLLVLAGYYIFIGMVREFLYSTAIYWSVATVLFIFLLSRVLSKIVRTFIETNAKKSKFLLILSWVIGAMVGWFLIPMLFMHYNFSYSVSLAMGLLGFIAISIFGMFISYTLLSNKWELELLPGFIIPIALLPTIPPNGRKCHVLRRNDCCYFIWQYSIPVSLPCISLFRVTSWILQRFQRKRCW